MPTGCQKTDFSQLAKDAGYTWTRQVKNLDQLHDALREADRKQGPVMIEVLVSLNSRADLGRPKENARENKEKFMENIKRQMLQLDGRIV